MRLLCVIPSYWPAFQLGGPIFSVHSLNKELVKRGVDVTVYTSNFGLETKVPLNQEVNVQGIKVIYFTFTKLFELMGTTGWQFSLPLARALKENLKTFDIVYIVAIWNYPVSIAAHYSRLYKKPYIISPRGLLYPYGRGKKNWKKWPYYQLITKRDLTGAAAIHYTTEDEEEKCHLPLGLKNRAFIITNGIDLSEFEDLPDKRRLSQAYPITKDKKVIVFLGRITWKKGLDVLVKAFSLLAQEREDIHLLIVGSDEAGYSKKVKRWLKNYGICDRVTFTGMLLSNEKLAAFAGSDIFVLPSYSENFGMSVIEALACKLPVIISDQVGIHKEVALSKAGIIISPNVEDLLKAMKNLLDNPHICSEMGENGYRLVKENFELDKVADKMLEAFKSILK